jgi:hypothetical protein
VSFLTEAEVRTLVQRRGRQLAEAELRKAAAADLSTRFDVFLSHSFSDAELIAGVKLALEAEGLRVYVDWIDDRQLDRSHVTVRTADVLRTRMRHSRSLIFATSNTSSASKWMPWELGYFDGFQPGHVGILPLVKTPGSDFEGQEYLGLYPYIEHIRFTDREPGLAISTSATRAQPIRSFVASGFSGRS